MKTTIKTHSAGNTAGILYRAFGDVREWSDFLSDCRRGKTAFYGLRLLPCCQCHDGTAYRPVYAFSDIREFIKAAIAKKPALVGASKSKIIFVDLDAADPSHWRRIKIKPAESASLLA